MRLIINSDDFGYSRAHNYGILDCFLEGVLTATTLMNNVPGTTHAYQLAQQHPELDVGIHFVLTHGRPLTPASQIPSLVTASGEFLSYDALQQAELNPEEIYLEWSAQLNRQLAAGCVPSHGDSHHHVHMLPEIFPIFCRLATEQQLAIRFHAELLPLALQEEYRELSRHLPQAELFLADFFDETVSVAYFEGLPFTQDLTVEVMAHPAYLDQRLLTTSSYQQQRTIEAEVLQSASLKALLAQHDVALITFKDLSK